MAEQQQPSTDVSITVNDLALVVRIIDLASERGAFRGAELSTVGAARDNVAKFVEVATAKSQAEQPAEEPVVEEVKE